MLSALISLVIALLIVGVVYWVVMKLLGTVGEMPAIIPVVLYILIEFLTSLGGMSFMPGLGRR